MISHFLSPLDYDTAEQAATESVPNRIIECCQPVTFAKVGYPTRIQSIRAARRFIDAVHEGRSEITFRDLIGALTEEEMSLLRGVAEKVALASEQIYDRRTVPRSTLLRALAIVRQIDILYPERQQIVLEIGGGTGYVGALLLEMGVRYVSTDVTQAFYIVQNHVLNAVAGGRVLELATDAREFFGLEGVPAGHAVHVPWWKFVVTRPQPKFTVDLVTCNHAILEMDATALKYHARLTREMLAGDGFRGFMFEGWGSPVRTAIWQATRSLSQAGLCFAYNDGQFPILVRTDAEAAKNAYHLPNAGDHDGDEMAWHPSIFVDSGSTLAKRISVGRAAIRERGRHDLQDYDAMLREVAGYEDLSTEDERFLSHCYEDLNPPRPKILDDSSAPQDRSPVGRTPAIARLFRIGSWRR